MTAFALARAAVRRRRRRPPNWRALVTIAGGLWIIGTTCLPSTRATLGAGIVIPLCVVGAFVVRIGYQDIRRFPDRTTSDARLRAEIAVCWLAGMAGVVAVAQLLVRAALGSL